MAFLCVLSAFALSCSETPEVVVPQSGTVLLSETKRLTPVMRSSIEGVYRVVNGGDVFGDQVALKWSYVVSANRADTTFTLSAFTGRDMAYLAMEGGTLDSVFFFTGYWRKMANTETGTARFTITSARGGRQLFQRRPVVGKDSIVMLGEYGVGEGLPDRVVEFIYDRPLYNGRRFEMFAHRGGGRTSDMLPVSENSVEMILFTPRLGTTGLELDVHFTKDGVPVLYHDNELNSRLTQKGGLVGDLEEYTYAQLYAFVRLIHGERIPTLEQALDAALYRTPIRTVWLDNKASANLAIEREIQKKYNNLATAMGRDFTIYIGLPSEDKVNEFLKLPDYASTPSICELSLDDVRKVNPQGGGGWGPRWTLGTQLGEVGQMHAEKRKVYVWTIDVPGYAESYIRQGDFDGIVSNYSPMIAYFHYTR